jgi:B12-binding domain/radical SAM domain protein
MFSLTFIRNRANRNSLMALGGAIERTPSLRNLQVKFARDLRQIKLAKKTVIAFSFMTPDVPKIARKITGLKKENLILIAGGPHPSGAPDQTLKMGFDYCFIGEGEESLISFLTDWLRNKLPKNRIIKSRPIDITQYPPVSLKFNLFGPIEITRGCPFGCKFCQTSYLFNSVRHRTIEQIVWAAEEMAERGFGDIRFVTPNLLAYGSRTGFKPNLLILEKMLTAVRETKGVKQIFAGTFPSEIRPEQISEKGLKIIRQYCDNDNLIIGAQSGSDLILKACHRGHTVEDVHRAIELVLGAGFKVNVDFIFGLPDETKRTERETIKMIEKLIGKAGVRIHSHYFLPLPGTPWAKEKPTKISPQLREFLIDLRKRGKEYGDWQEQEKMATLDTPTQLTDSES